MSAAWDWDQDRRDALEDARQHPEMDTRDIPTLAECERDEREAEASLGEPEAPSCWCACKWNRVGQCPKCDR